MNDNQKNLRGSANIEPVFPESITTKNIENPFNRPSNWTMMTRKRSLANVSSAQTDKKTSQDPAKVVKEARTAAIQMMAKAGFTIPDNVKVKVDPQLPIMGYTMPQGQGFTIVVSGGAARSEMLQALLVHEMSHVYRIQTNHPSHNTDILEEAAYKLRRKDVHSDYQEKIVHDLLNDIQDLYADDIAFRVLRTSRAPVLDQVPEFLQEMIADTPVETGDQVKDRWVNASIMTHNARAIAQMTKHRIDDTGNRAEQANKRFLSRVSPNVAKNFDFFRDTLANLREDITDREQSALLAHYLNRFLEIVEEN